MRYAVALRLRRQLVDQRSDDEAAKDRQQNDEVAIRQEREEKAEEEIVAKLHQLSEGHCPQAPAYPYHNGEKVQVDPSQIFCELQMDIHPLAIG
ncbi:MAG: hypothetical protein A4E43_01002 [Methanosaeta sp. PtaB.Bin005]|nr:MAG: hypothetical protein A4E43_01002 [Methanosaeta sp. PtaB.Bin005]